MPVQADSLQNCSELDTAEQLYNDVVHASEETQKDVAHASEQAQAQATRPSCSLAVAARSGLAAILGRRGQHAEAEAAQRQVC